ncbi:MAG: DUF998 domain-containing protein [Aquihabitans sp.]
MGYGLVAGPVAFVGAWVVGGSRLPDYSPVHDAISRLAAVGSSERWLMSAGFVTYGAALVLGSQALRGTVLERLRPALVINAVATWMVAAAPLDHSALVDRLHGVAATTGYLALAMLPFQAARPLRASGRPRAAMASSAAAALIGVALAATVVVDAKGLAQRAGLTIGDAWLVAAGLALASGRLTRRDP